MEYEIITAEKCGLHSYSIYEIYPDGSIRGSSIRSTGYCFFSEQEAESAAEKYMAGLNAAIEESKDIHTGLKKGDKLDDFLREF